MPAKRPAEPSPPNPVNSTYDRFALFHDLCPFPPTFMRETMRTLMRTLPLDTNEPPAWTNRRMNAALIALAALNPRDEIEVMLSVQAVAAYHAAAATWYLGMNHHHPRGDSTRHFAAAATAARTFDAMLKAVERRQARPIAVPPGRPEPKAWPPEDLNAKITTLANSVAEVGAEIGALDDDGANHIEWNDRDLDVAATLRETERVEAENQGLDIENTTGILPGGGMVVPADPTPQQEAYIARRLGLSYKREYAETIRQGGTTLPKIRPIRTGDFVE
jgi:hypothetical protein